MIRSDLLTQIHAEATRDKALARVDALMEDMRQQLDPIMKDWIPSGSGYTSDAAQVLVSDPAKLREESRKAYVTNPYGRNIIRTLVKFIIGAGVMVDFAEKDEKALKAIMDYWAKTKKRIKWKAFVREYVRRLFRDGETIVRQFAPEQAGMLALRYVEPDTLPDDGIMRPENDKATITGYRFNGETERVPAEKVHFQKADVDCNMLRGRPILEPILPYLTKYSRWLDARMVLNIVRASVTIVQEIQGNATSVLDLANKNTTRKNDRNNATKMIRPGTIIRGTPGVQYKMLSPNLDARDAAEDGRTILLAVAASAGFPDMLVTADFSGSNFANSVIAQNPAIREFEEWQEYIGEGLAEIIEWLLMDGLVAGEIPATVIDEESGQERPVNMNFTVGFPPLLRRDIGQENNAYLLMYENGALSKRTWDMKMGFDYDQEKKYIDEEGGPPEPKSAEPGQASPKRPEDRTPRQNVTGSGESHVRSVPIDREPTQGDPQLAQLPNLEA